MAIPTHGKRILDVIISNLHVNYDKAVILPPIQPYNPKFGKPSDHHVDIVRPNKDAGFSRTEWHSRRVTSPANLIKLGIFLACFDWRFLHQISGADAKLASVEEVIFSAQDCFCPEEFFRVKLNGNFRVSAKLARLSAEKSKEFKANR